MIVPVKSANYLAHKSCPKWNQNPISRRLCRYTFWGLASIDHFLWSPASTLRIPRSADHSQLGDTYPRIFRLIEDWEEDEGALVVDPANFVLKYATSYCAWKISELTGHWPTNVVIPKDAAHAAEIAQRERKHDAKYWLEFLEAQDCFKGVVTHPELMDNLSGHYIGIDPSYGEYGLVVWFEEAIHNVYATNATITARVSTYENKQYLRKEILLSDFIWVEVGKKAVH